MHPAANLPSRWSEPSLLVNMCRAHYIYYTEHHQQPSSKDCGRTTTDPEMLTFRVSASMLHTSYFCAESIINVWGQWGTSHSARRGTQLHQAVTFLFFFFFFFFVKSWGETAQGLNFKANDKRRCESFIMHPLPKIKSLKHSKGTIGSCLPLMWCQHKWKETWPSVIFTTASEAWLHSELSLVLGVFYILSDENL